MTKRVRTREPFRGQAIMRFEVPDDALPEDHRARLLWKVIETLDLGAFTAHAKAVEGHQGRPLASTRMMLTLWLYAISVGIGSARKIERLTRDDVAFQWIAGDQSISHSRLSDFRVAHGAALDKLFGQSEVIRPEPGLPPQTITVKAMPSTSMVFGTPYSPSSHWEVGAR